MFIFTCAQLPVLAVSVLPVLGMLPTFGVLVQNVLACSCCVGVIRAVLVFRGPCRVEISVFACPCRVCPALIYMYIYICGRDFHWLCLCLRKAGKWS